MVKHQVFRPRSDPRRHDLRGGLRKAPWSRELSAEKHSAIQLHAAEDLGECIHSVLWINCKWINCKWINCKVSWLPRKAMRLRWPSEQLIATLGHSSASSCIAQL